MPVYWTVIISVVVPLLMIVVASLVSEFQDPDNNPATPPPMWIRILKVIQLVWTARAPEGRVGIGGTQWSVPLVHWPKKENPVVGNVIGAGPKEEGEATK